MHTWGSTGLLQTLLKNDLIDEYRLFIVPVVLGVGKRLFGSGTVPVALKQVESVTTGKDATYHRLERVGKPEYGQIGTQIATMARPCRPARRPSGSASQRCPGRYPEELRLETGRLPGAAYRRLVGWSIRIAVSSVAAFFLTLGECAVQDHLDGRGSHAALNTSGDATGLGPAARLARIRARAAGRPQRLAAGE